METKPYPRKIVFDGQSKDHLNLLLETIEGINRTVELKSLLQESMEAARMVMDAEAGSLMLLDQSTGEIYISLPTGPVKDEIKGTRIPKNRGICGWVVKHKQPYFSNDPQKLDIFWGDVAENFETKSIICVPLLNIKQEVIGVIQAINTKKEGGFTSKDIPVFQALASQVSIAIERAKAQEKFLREKEAMLTEIHHRVKNNLATISALIEVEMEELHSDHAKQVLKNTHSRLQSMAEVHDLLCNNGYIDYLDLGRYLEQLSDRIAVTLSKPQCEIDINIEADSVEVAASKVILCGFVLNELLVNVYKHAFEGQEQGRITIKLTDIPDGRVKLEVTDNGVGITSDFDLENANSIGTWVINAFLNKLKAEVQIERDNGTSFTIEFQK